MTDAMLAVPRAAEHLTRRHWVVLVVTVLLWLFDGYETYVLLLTIGPSLHALLPLEQLPGLPRYAAYLISATLFGWAVGGVLGGLLGDLVGRRWTMIGAVLAYSLFTGTSALAGSWQMLALTRVLTGAGIGAEWGVGTSLLQEMWPERLRTKAAGVLQAAFSGGFLVASLAWLAIGGWLGGSWRWMYLLGIAPALLVAAAGRAIPESERWTRTRHTVGVIGTTLRAHRRELAVALVVSIAITVGFWAISSWVPTYAGSLAHNPRDAVTYAGWSGGLYAVGEMVGCVAYGWLSDAWGRKPTALFYLLGSLTITPVVFLWLKDPIAVAWAQLPNGLLTGGLYGWYAVQPAELFPTRIRASAISIIFNAARLIAMFGPLMASTLIGFFGGYGPAATILASIFLVGAIAVPLLPETRGRPLPG